jgi:hypothetical protein
MAFLSALRPEKKVFSLGLTDFFPRAYLSMPSGVLTRYAPFWRVKKHGQDSRRDEYDA